MTFTSLEKQAIVYFTVSLIMADGNEDPREDKVLFDAGTEMGLNRSEVMALVNKSGDYDPGTAVGTVRNMSYDGRQWVASLLKKLIAADGVIHPAEQKFYNMIAIMCNLPR